ncbi:WSSV007 [White spot syndrome virus]|uniref:WSSV007 n=1 Tax=White spot syndrome virus TaxID=342409 RepID=A0A2I6SBE4_9VIRU|nr:WSSV007 [White spot syndrome virus]
MSSLEGGPLASQCQIAPEMTAPETYINFILFLEHVFLETDTSRKVGHSLLFH